MTKQIFLMIAMLGLSSCSSPTEIVRPTPPDKVMIEGVRFTASVQRIRQGFLGVLTARNTTDTPVDLLLRGGNCQFILRAFRSETLKGTLVWTSHHGEPCQLIELPLELGPGDESIIEKVFTSGEEPGRQVHFSLTFAVDQEYEIAGGPA